ncbi:MAG TPA: PhnD/SsuA/transferrin family substrate-binding protein [Alphaproteobacteria bacterium]|nr:PhnD/SsuA/transferrin family substrate-binding protein [Alphaproteobacteria bacterium]
MAAVVAGPTTRASAEVHLVFGVYASDKPSAMVEQMRPTLDVLERTLAGSLHDTVKIELKVLRDYDTGIAVLTSGDVDFARLGAVSYVEAKAEAPGIELLASELNGDVPYFHGVICVQRDGPIHAIEDLRGKTFAFGAEQSTMGRYVAQLFLAQSGITAGDLKSFEYLGRHDRVATAVASGQFDAGALEETIFTKLVNEGLALRPLASYRDLTKAWVARVGLDPQITAKLRDALVAMRNPAALQALRFDGFTATSDADYNPTRAAIKENSRFFQKPRS